MSVVRLEKVGKSFGGVPVLVEVDFRVEEREKIGLIGRNGTGKSTLFRLLTGETKPDSGTVERMKRARIAHLSQIPDVAPSTPLFDVVLGRFQDILEMEAELRSLEDRISRGDDSVMEKYGALQDEFGHRGGYEFRASVKRVLTGLGFTEDEFGLNFDALSGGQRTRLMLALVLLEQGDLLLLDEPENHLDLQAREWLEGFLREWTKAFVVISHDRQLLNAVTERTVEVERGVLRGFTGNYDAYVKHKALLDDQQGKAFQRQQDFIAKEESWINRFRYKNTKARQVQSRIKRLEKLERLEAPVSEQASGRFSLGEVVRSGQVVLEAKELSKAYGDLVLYENVTVAVARGERVGIVGPNGSGKTTFLRHLAGRLDDGGGTVVLGHKVSTGFYDQQHDNLNPANDILAEVGTARPEMTPEQIRTFMGRFLFVGDDIFKRIGTLSGGERSRVAVAKLVLGGANLLLLDEPTNHLDIASREALEEALSAFPGAMVVVSHDRALIDRLVDKLLVIADGKGTVYLGNYSHYRWKLGESQALDSEGQGDSALKIRKNGGKKESNDSRKASEKVLRQRRKRLEDLEETIHEIEELVRSFEARFAELDPADYQGAATLTQEYEAMKADLREMYSEWEDLAEGLSQKG